MFLVFTVDTTATRHTDDGPMNHIKIEIHYGSDSDWSPRYIIIAHLFCLNVDHP